MGSLSESKEKNNENKDKTITRRNARVFMFIGRTGGGLRTRGLRT